MLQLSYKMQDLESCVVWFENIKYFLFGKEIVQKHKKLESVFSKRTLKHVPKLEDQRTPRNSVDPVELLDSEIVYLVSVKVVFLYFVL